MEQSIIIAGFGGQGILFAGMILAYAGMESDKNVTWMPSYGPEIRGGTANVTVIISDEEVGSPIVLRPHAVIALNIPSMHKYEPLVRPGGLLVYNTTIVHEQTHRDDIRYVPLPAGEIAAELGNDKMANMAALGALVQSTAILEMKALVQALADHLPEKRRHLLQPNHQALLRGAHVALELSAPIPVA